MNNNLKVEIIEFTDPVCTWCWGSEPLLKELKVKYKDQVKVKYIMGGLVKDINQFYDSFNDIGGDANNSNKQIVAHWLEASNKHQMPVNSENFNLFSNDYPSTYPQNIAYKAAQMEDETLANNFLRRLREATITEGKITSQLGVLIELASEVGLEVAKFIERYSNGSAETAFLNDLKLTHDYGVRGFPSFLIRYGEKEILLRGYQTYPTIKAVIDSLTNKDITEYPVAKSSEAILEFISKYKSVAPVEIITAFTLNKNEYKSIIDNLLAESKIIIEEIGNGSFIKPTSNPLLCDADDGECNI